MNVILESERGNELICIQEFLATPEGVPFSTERSHTFRVGERVRFFLPAGSATEAAHAWTTTPVRELLAAV